MRWRAVAALPALCRVVRSAPADTAGFSTSSPSGSVTVAASAGGSIHVVGTTAMPATASSRR